MDLALTSDEQDMTGDQADGVNDADVKLTGKSPLRRCIVSREVLDKRELIRFVLDPDGQVVPDLRNRLPGRGLWLKADLATLLAAIKTNAFAKAAKQSAKIPADLRERVAALLYQDVAGLLGLARKSSDLTTGFEKVERDLRANRVAVLIAAKDGAMDGRTKLAWLAGSDVEIWSPLTAVDLAAALGKETAVHVALKHSGIAERLHLACRRLAAFEAADAPIPGKRT